MIPQVPETTQAPVATTGRVLVQSGEVLEIALNRLKASPKNARRVGHTAEDIEARAASIKAKGLLQPLVVEPEAKEDGQPTGHYLVTIGEGRRQALKLLARRKQIAKGELVRCVIDTVNDPAEISLDENVSRRAMHPADEFEAFKELADRKGWSAEEISARFGPSPDTVRRRLRLGAVAPALLDLYREEVLTLDQVMAFAVNPDTERQMQVYAQLPAHNRQVYAIRRAMTEAKVPADDRRVAFIGLDAYVAAGGPVLRDLFTEDGEGWIEDVVLLDRLVGEKLAALAQEVRDSEGWKWSSAYLDFPHGHGWSRIWEHALTRSLEDADAINVLREEESALIDRWADVDPPPPEVAARLEEIEAALEAFGDDFGFEPEEKARAGVLVVLSHDGQARIDRGFVRPEDEPAPEPEGEEDGGEGEVGESDGFLDEADGDEHGGGDAEGSVETLEPAGDPAAPLPDRVIAELTAHRSAALRDALAKAPDLALVALVHVLALRVFAMGSPATCLDIRWASRDLGGFGEGIEDSPAGLAIAERHRTWARQMPDRSEDFWSFVVGLDGDSRASLLAHCVALSLDGVRSWERRPVAVLGHVETLATALDLDMRAYWQPTAVRYLDRVTKAHIQAAVSDGVSAQAAGRLAGLKKPDMVAAAEPQLVEAGWLPALLRTAKANGEAQDEASSSETEGHFDADGLKDDQPPFSTLDEAVLDQTLLSEDDEAEVSAMLTAAE